MPICAHPISTQSVTQALSWSVKVLSQADIASAQTEAEWLLADVLGVGRAGLYLSGRRHLTPAQQHRLCNVVEKRRSRMPLQQVLGKAEFFSLEFGITPDVLVPRPETEVLVAVLVERLKSRRSVQLLDVGTGCGAIAVSLAHALPNSRVVAVDLSGEALRVARSNARLQGVENRVYVVRADLLSPFFDRPTFHAVASNPPYIPTDDLERLQPEVRNFEPRISLDGGADGLRFFGPVISLAGVCLRTGGVLAMEVGQGQADRVASTLSASSKFDRMEILPDLNGIDRIVLAYKKEQSPGGSQDLEASGFHDGNG